MLEAKKVPRRIESRVRRPRKCLGGLRAACWRPRKCLGGLRAACWRPRKCLGGIEGRRLEAKKVPRGAYVAEVLMTGR